MFCISYYRLFQKILKENKTVNIPADADEAHMHDAGWTREHITRDVHVAPHHTKWPIPCEEINFKQTVHSGCSLHDFIFDDTFFLMWHTITSNL